MPKRNKENKISEIKEYESPFIITPIYNKDCTELVFYYLVIQYQKLNLKQISHK